MYPTPPLSLTGHGIIQNCPLCESANSGMKSTVFGQNSIFIESANILECESCGFMFLQNQLSDDELNIFYNTKYRDIKQELLTKNRFLGDKERAISQLNYWGQYVNKDINILEVGGGWGVNANYLYDSGFTKLTVNEWDDNINLSLNKNIYRITTPIWDLGTFV